MPLFRCETITVPEWTSPRLATAASGPRATLAATLKFDTSPEVNAPPRATETPHVDSRTATG